QDKGGFHIGYGPAETDLSGAPEHQKEVDDALGELGGNGTKISDWVSGKNGVRFAVSTRGVSQPRGAGKHPLTQFILQTHLFCNFQPLRKMVKAFETKQFFCYTCGIHRRIIMSVFNDFAKNFSSFAKTTALGVMAMAATSCSSDDPQPNPPKKSGLTIVPVN